MKNFSYSRARERFKKQWGSFPRSHTAKFLGGGTNLVDLDAREHRAAGRFGRCHAPVLRIRASPNRRGRCFDRRRGAE